MNNPIIAIEDNFLESIEDARIVLYQSEFLDLKAPDNVTYPFICDKIPKEIRYEFIFKLEKLINARIDPVLLFAREMPENCKAPNNIHSDRDMANFTAHLTFSDNAYTDFLCHKKLGFFVDSTNLVINQDIINQNKNNFETYLRVHHKPNRLIVHHAGYYHCAEPQEGFGSSRKDARLVITCFFNLI